MAERRRVRGLIAECREADEALGRGRFIAECAKLMPALRARAAA
jgi:hypothetical protein